MALLICSVFVLVVYLSCGGGDTRVYPEDFLPQSISALDLQQSSDLLIFRGDSISYYNNDPEFFHRFGFVDMASADYSADDILLEVELFRFATPEDAFGIYSHMRWGHSDDVISLAVEGFRTPTEIHLVKDAYVVHLMIFDESEAHSKMLEELGDYFAEELPGDTDMPEKFSLFPEEGVLSGSAMYFPDQFLRLEFMKCVYGCYCEVESDTVFLALACDSAGPMVLQWSEMVQEDSTFRPLPDDIPYDDGKGFTFSSPYLGRVMIGVKNGIMAAILGYNDNQKQFLTDWLNSLPAQSI